jgi:hypothetical protein
VACPWEVGHDPKRRSGAAGRFQFRQCARLATPSLKATGTGAARHEHGGADSDCRSHYARAREDQGDVYVDEIIEMRDKATPENAHAYALK